MTTEEKKKTIALAKAYKKANALVDKRNNEYWKAKVKLDRATSKKDSLRKQLIDSTDGSYVVIVDSKTAFRIEHPDCIWREEIIK